MCMLFYPKRFCKFQMPAVYLDDHPLKWVQEHKYLGVIISSDGKDDVDIDRQIKSFYVRENMLIRKFKTCSIAVKVQLFKIYCNNMYAGHLWCNQSPSYDRKIKTAYNNVF